MGTPKSGTEYASGVDTDLLVSDSLTISEQYLTAARIDAEEESRQGDIINGLRHALILSTVLWAAIILAVVLFFL